MRYGNLRNARAAEDIAAQNLESLRRQAVIQVEQAQRQLVVAEQSDKVAHRAARPRGAERPDDADGVHGRPGHEPRARDGVRGAPAGGAEPRARRLQRRQGAHPRGARARDVPLVRPSGPAHDPLGAALSQPLASARLLIATL